MVIKHPCAKCEKAVAKNHRAIQCDICNQWVHIRCNGISEKKYETLKDDPDPFICIVCITSTLPFSQENDESLYLTMVKGLNINANLESININLDKQEKDLIKHISNLILQNSNDPEMENADVCRYYNTEKFCKAKFQKKNNFSILHLNIDSLQFHIEDLKLMLKLLNFEFDIISITETRLRKNIHPTTDVNLQNYQYEHTPTEAKKGGTLIYISNKLSYKPRKDLEIYDPTRVESTFIEILNSRGKNTIVGSIYRHHSITETDYLEIMKPLLKQLTSEKKPTYITGDFNMDLMKINKHTIINEYFDEITSNNFMPLITLPTRITASTKTLIDNIFYNQFSPDIVSGNILVGISDHMPQFSIITQSNQFHLPKRHNIYRRNFKNFDHDNFDKELSNINWTYTHLANTPDVDESLNHFLSDVDILLDKYAPIRKVSNKEYKQKAKPWITTQIIKLIKIRDKIFQNFIKETTPQKKEYLHRQHKIAKNRINNQIRNSKKAFYDNYFLENSQNVRNLWKGINELVNTKHRYNSLPDSIQETNQEGIIKTITDPKQIPDAFNNYFSTVASQILKSRKYTGNKHFSQYLKTANINTFLIKKTDQIEIESIISLFNTQKSVGPNSIPNQVIKQIRYSISQPIMNICNNSFTSGKYPDKLKISRIIPIHKKESKLLTSNYRPISLLSNINKIIEKLMFSRLYMFLETYNCIYNNQFGFREKHSTNHALISITQKIKDAIDNDKIAIGIFIDLQKAFDTVNHEILLSKLHHYGIQGTSNEWFRSYLSNRKQYVSINGFDSSLQNVIHGVPQGSVLGPLLFLLYINDLHACVHNSDVFHFADDTNLLHIPKHGLNKRNIRRINTDLKSLNQWLLANKISLNTTKTELIVFRKKHTSIPKYTEKIMMNGMKLLPAKEIKYLGLIFDEHLSWLPQIRNINAKLNRAINLLSKARHYIPHTLLLHLYYGQFYSQLLYGCQLWGQELNEKSQTFILQKKAIRIITFSHFTDHANPLFKKLNILKVLDIIKMNNFMFVHNALNNQLPKAFENYFKQIQTQTEHPTRNEPKSLYSILNGSVELPNIKNKTAEKNSIQYQSSVTWNNLLKALTSERNDTQTVLNKKSFHELDTNWLTKLKIHEVKKLLKAHFINKY